MAYLAMMRGCAHRSVLPSGACPSVASLPMGDEGAAGMERAAEIADPSVRQSAITSHSIGVEYLQRLLQVVPPDATEEDYQRAVVDENALGLETESGREWRFKTLRRLYFLRPDSVLFRSLRDLWPVDQVAQPLLATLCALATDTVFRASAGVIQGTTSGDEIRTRSFAAAVQDVYADAYADSTLEKVASNAYASWEQSGHLGEAEEGRKLRQRATCRPPAVAYALMLGHMQGRRGEALFSTVWTDILDRPASHLHDQAFAASRGGMIEFRKAGGVIEVGFTELLRPMETQLL